MSIITLESGLAQATILPERGALITDLKLLDRTGKQRNVLWLPESFTTSSLDTWPGGGLPFLFPFAGRVWHAGEVLKYSVAGNVFDMPLHGFAWARCWTGSSKSPHVARLALKSDQQSKGVYPFDFELIMTVTLSHHALNINLELHYTTNPAKTREKMPVAIGWHPYLSVAGALKAQIHADTAYPVTAVGNAGNPQSASEMLGPSPWVLPNSNLSSLILGDLTPESSRLDFATHSINISAGPDDVMQHVVTWSNQPSEFLCIEPWMSLPDAVARPTGCRWLKPGESLSAWISLECR